MKNTDQNKPPITTSVNASIEKQFKAKSLPKCTCGNSSLLNMNLHNDNCNLRLVYEHNCMVTHTYYAKGYKEAEAYVVQELAQLRAKCDSLQDALEKMMHSVEKDDEHWTLADQLTLSKNYIRAKRTLPAIDKI